MIQPGSTLGMLGGGQLGRMTALAARNLGYRFHTFEPSADCPAGPVSDVVTSAPFDDRSALDAFANSVDLVTLEFENIPAEALRRLGERKPVAPGASVLEICQNRAREKRFLQSNDFPHAPFRVVHDARELKQAVSALGCPCVLKTAAFGYDGKGQVKINEPGDEERLWNDLDASAGVVEAWIDFSCELSVICARGHSGELVPFPVSENIHTAHILDFSIVPARIDPAVSTRAMNLARSIAEALEIVGLIAVELFLDRDGNLIVNELAPRPHNSGHYTLNACVTSQFEQHVRAVCGMPLGSVDLHSPVVMVNLLGDLWSAGEPRWCDVLANPLAKLHLYGKSAARPGRKMGHVNVLADDTEQAFDQARRIKDALRGRSAE